MADLLLLAIGASVLDAIVLAGVLGSRAVVPPSRRIDAALRIGFATLCVVTIASGLGYAAWRALLVPFALGELRALVLVLLVGALAQAADRLPSVLTPARRDTMDHTAWLVTINGALLALALPELQPMNSMIASLAFGAAAGSGFALTFLVFTLLLERIESSDVPRAFRGAPIALVTAGLMALALVGLDGFGTR